MENIAREYQAQVLKKLQGETEYRLTITVPQMAKLINLNLTSSYELCRRADFPKLKIGKRIIVPIIPFLAWLENQAKSEE